MPAEGSSSQRIVAQQVIGAWGESLLKGRRVAVFGDSASGLAEHIAASCGRRVHLYDPDPKRAAASLAQARSPKVTYCALDADLDLRAGAYDAVVIADLDVLNDAKAAIANARELLSRRGVLLLAASASGTLDYYALYDTVADAFENVTMLGQAPFAGYTVAAFGAEGEPTVMIDSSLAGPPQQPQRFVAVASDQPIEVEAYTLVQLPAAAAAAWTAPPSPALADATELAEARLQASLLSAELRALKDNQQERADELANRQRLEKNLSVRVAELEADLARGAQQLKAKLREENKRRVAIEKQLRQTQLALEEANNQAASALQQAEDSFQEELDTVLERVAELEELLETQQAGAVDQVSAETARADAAEQRALRAEKEIAAAKRRTHEAEKMALRAEKMAAEAKKKAAAAKKQLSDATELADAGAAQASGAAKQAADAQALARVAEQKARAAEKKAADAEKKAADADKRARDLEKKAAAADKKARDLEKKVAAARVVANANGVDIYAHEIHTLEQLLLQRGATVSTLKAQLQETERTGRELPARVITLTTEAAAPTPDGSLTTLSSEPDSERPSPDEVATLLQRCSRYEADLRAAQWQVEALSNKLEQVESTTPGDYKKLEAALRQTHDELAKLRQHDRR
ncbi:MAG TPA: hypothetical protein ENK23_03315 [Sorangium sp.]|nr:hypothetical protein [Sorangium sp.]